MISIVIPTLNSEAELTELLNQLNSEALDIIVSDGTSTDKTLNIALDHNLRLALGCKGRGWQLARGARWAQGEWLFFVHADSVLPDDWQSLVKHHIDIHPNKAGYFKFSLNARGLRPRIMEFLANARSSVFALPYGDQGLLISRELYDKSGGFPNRELFEDVAIVQKLGRRRLRKIPGAISTSAARFERRGYLKSWLSNMSLLARYFLGFDPEKLAKVYEK